MITVTEKPADVVFSRNPVLFEFTTDNRYAAIGRPYIFTVTFSQGQIDYTGFRLQWNGESLAFLFRTNPDDSGLHLPPYPGIGSISEWLDTVVQALRRNYYLATSFVVEKTGTDTIRFTSILRSTAYNVTYTNLSMTGTTRNEVQTAQNSELHKNFALLLELWVEREDKSGYDRYSQSTVEVDNNGAAIWDVQQYLTAILLKDGPVLPDYQTGTVVVDSRSVRHFYIAYSEMYGEPQRVKRTQQTAPFLCLLGGFSNDTISFGLPQHFLDPFDQVDWMDYVGIHRIHREQDAFGSLVNFIEDFTDIKVIARIGFHDTLVTTHELFSFPVWKKNTKVVVPIGLSNALSKVTERQDIKFADIWLESSGKRISANLSISIDATMRPALMTLMYLNSFGCFETLYTYGKRSFGYDIDKTAEAFSSEVSNKPMLHSYKELGLKSRDTIKINSGYFPKYVIRRLRDFILSQYKYAQVSSKWNPVVLDSNAIDESADFENMTAISFSLKYANEERLWGE